MSGRIFNSVDDLRQFADENQINLVVTSGGFDPIHVGHLRCLQASAAIAEMRGHNYRVAVIVNGDGFLQRKKSYAFMPEAERIEIIAGIKGVDFVAPWDDGSQTVTGALSVLMPKIFTKGGDRDSAQNVPEFDLCKEINCEVIFGIGGGKIQSSSELVVAVKSAA
jgi:cytidyltransferase-like protein